MKSIKEIVTKPSEAVRAMVRGLNKQSKRKDFEINMDSFGAGDGTMCYGCAATCAIQEIAQKNFKPNSNMNGSFNRAITLGLDGGEVNRFETIINEVRQGKLSSLFDFYRLSLPIKFQNRGNFYLENDNWREELPKVRNLIRSLQRAGY